MSQKDAPGKESIAATDAVFQEGLAPPGGPAVPEVGSEVRMPPPPPPPQGTRAATPGEPRSSVSRVGDYVR